MRTLEQIITEAKNAYRVDDKPLLRRVLDELDARPEGITSSMMAEMRLSPKVISDILEEPDVVIPSPVKSNTGSLTLDEISAEIKQLNKLGVNNVIEIGRLLSEAKEEVKHGEWIAWVKNNTAYSNRYVSKLMKTYELNSNSKGNNCSFIRPELLIQLSNFPTTNGIRDNLINVLSTFEKDTDIEVTTSTLHELHSVLVGVDTVDEESLTTLLSLLSDVGSRKSIGYQLKSMKSRDAITDASKMLDAYSESLVEPDFTSSVIDFPRTPVQQDTLTTEDYDKFVESMDTMVLEDVEYVPQYTEQDIKTSNVEQFVSNTRYATSALWSCLDHTTTEVLAEELMATGINFSKLDAYIEKLEKIRDIIADTKQQQTIVGK